MAKLQLLAGTTSKLIDVFIQDTSVTTGAGLTGLTNASGSLTWYYYREGAASAVQVTSIASMTLGTWVTKGFIVIDGTNMPGMYQLGVPDAALAAGAKSVVMMLKGAANMAPVLIEIELTATDNQTANLTAAQIATGVWQDATAGDFTVSSSIGKSLYTSGNAPGAASGIALVGSNMGSITGALTGAQIATAVWTDTTAGDFTTSASIGKSIMNGVTLGTGLTIASVSGNVTFGNTSIATVTNVTNISAGGIVAASFAANAITAAKLDPDVTTELQAGLATSTALSTLQTSVDDVPTNAELATALGTADDAVLAQVALVKAKTDLIPASPAAVGSAMTLTAAYDAAKTAATQTSVDDLPTNSELTAALAGADDATLAAIAALNNISAAAVNAEVDTALADVGLTTTITGRIDVAIGTRLATLGYTAPDNSTIAAIDAKTTNLPSDPADQSLIIAATNTLGGAISMLDAKVDTVDTVVDGIKTVTDALPTFVHTGGKLWTLDGDGNPVAPAAAVAALSIPTASANASAVFSSVTAAGFTFEEIVRLIAAVQLGKTDDTQGTIRNLEDTADAVLVTYDGNGDRTAMTLDPS